jgi:hypothetical protein
MNVTNKRDRQEQSRYQQVGVPYFAARRTCASAGGATAYKSATDVTAVADAAIAINATNAAVVVTVAVVNVVSVGERSAARVPEKGIVIGRRQLQHGVSMLFHFALARNESVCERVNACESCDVVHPKTLDVL